MGRVLKRVPMDFNWPVNKVWERYINPYPGDKGQGFYSPEQEQKYNSWVPQEPPSGVGFQMWETTTEGSPQSPVFETLEALAKWCAKNATVFAKEKASAEDWANMLAENNVYFQYGNITFV